MRIIFICGSLENGRDGVGDYTNKLAIDLIKHGHYCAIIALMDKYSKVISEEKQLNDNVEMPILRLPFKNGYFANSNIAKFWLNNLDPDLVSLQFVPFAFHDKGLHYNFSVAINKLVKGTKLHIMFHEMWVGMQIESDFKLKYWGLTQKNLIKNFILKVNPSYVTTHSALYLFQLRRLGVKASLLPLISNILINQNFKILQNNNIVRFVVFGNIHADAPIDSFAKDLHLYCEVNSLKPEIIFVGKNGNQLDNWIWSFKNYKIPTKVIGMQPESEISKYLVNSHIGLTSTPFILIQKSGTIAAMKEAQLPVICVAPNFTVKEFGNFQLLSYVFEYRENNLQEIFTKIKNNEYNFPKYTLSKLFLEIILAKE